MKELTLRQQVQILEGTAKYISKGYTPLHALGIAKASYVEYYDVEDKFSGVYTMLLLINDPNIVVHELEHRRNLLLLEYIEEIITVTNNNNDSTTN